MTVRSCAAWTLIITCALAAAQVQGAENLAQKPNGAKPDAFKRDDKEKRKPEGLQERNGIQFILDHEKELNLTASQKDFFEGIISKMNEQKEKLKNDPEAREMFMQMHEAQESGDEQFIRQTRKQLRELIEKKSGMTIEGVMKDIGKKLSFKQLAKLNELRKAEGMEDGMQKYREEKAEEAQDNNHAKPDAAKGAPKLYDEK